MVSFGWLDGQVRFESLTSQIRQAGLWMMSRVLFLVADSGATTSFFACSFSSRLSISFFRLSVVVYIVYTMYKMSSIVLYIKPLSEATAMMDLYHEVRSTLNGSHLVCRCCRGGYPALWHATYQTAHLRDFPLRNIDTINRSSGYTVSCGIGSLGKIERGRVCTDNAGWRHWEGGLLHGGGAGGERR